MSDLYSVAADLARQEFIEMLGRKGLRTDTIWDIVRNRWTVIVALRQWSEAEKEIKERLENETK